MTGVAWALVLAGSRRLQVDRRVAPQRPVAGDPLTFSFRVRSGRRVPGLQVTLETPSVGWAALRQATSWRASACAGPDGHRRAVGGPARRPPSPGVRRRRRGPARSGPRPPAGRRAAARHRRSAPPRAGVVRALRRFGRAPRRRPAAAAHPDAWEFRGIRPHDPGEPLNRVDWKSTAKTGSLMLREMEAASEDDFTLLLSGAPACDAGEPPDSRSRRPYSVAGSMSAFTLQNGHAVHCCCPSTIGDQSGSRRTRPAAAGSSERWRRPSLPDLPGSAHPCPPSSAAGRTCAGACSPSYPRLDRDLVDALLKLRRRASRCPSSTSPRMGGAAPRRAGADGAADGDLAATSSPPACATSGWAARDDLHAALAAAPARSPVRVR